MAYSFPYSRYYYGNYNASPYYTSFFKSNHKTNPYHSASCSVDNNTTSKYITSTEQTYSTDLNKKADIEDDREFIDILGITLYYDDILLICLLFFLYNEGVKDQYLFISLILLLLS